MKEPIRLWYDTEVDQLRKYVADNLSNAEIAERTGRTISSVKAKLSRMLLPARTRPQRNWPPEEIAQLCYLRDDVKLNFDEIGRRLGRPHSTCYQKYYDLKRAPPKNRVTASREPMAAETHREWLHRMSLSPANLTAAFFGDPLPGCSALDKRRP